MRIFVISIAAWSGIVAGMVLLWPATVPPGGCWRLIDPPPACSDQLAELNRQIWWSQTAPMLAVIVGGYALLALAAIRSMSRRRKARADERFAAR